MKFSVQVLIVRGHCRPTYSWGGIFEVEAESAEEAREKFNQFIAEKKQIQIQEPPEGQEVFIDINPITDVVPEDEQELLTGPEEVKE